MNVSIANIFTLFAYLLASAMPTSIFIYGIYMMLKAPHYIYDNLFLLTMTGIIGLSFLFLIARFFKIILITKAQKVYLYYPFIFYFKQFSLDQIIVSNSFKREMFRYFKKFDFTYYKTSDGFRFITSNFIYLNYKALDNKLNRNAKHDYTFEFFTMKDKILLVIFAVIVVVIIGIILAFNETRSSL